MTFVSTTAFTAGQRQSRNRSRQPSAAASAWPSSPQSAPTRRSVPPLVPATDPGLPVPSNGCSVPLALSAMHHFHRDVANCENRHIDLSASMRTKPTASPGKSRTAPGPSLRKPAMHHPRGVFPIPAPAPATISVKPHQRDRLVPRFNTATLLDQLPAPPRSPLPILHRPLAGITQPQAPAAWQ